MSNIAHYAAMRMLDWSLKASTYASPAAMFAGLSLTNAPATAPAASSEVGAGSGYTRSSMTFGAAATPAGSASASNQNAQTWGPFSNTQTIAGLFLADTVSSGAGNMLWGGALATVRTPQPGDQLVLAAGALAITLN